MVKRERIGDTLYDYEYMFAKIRNEQVSNGQVIVPFSVYLYFLKPEDIKGREVSSCGPERRQIVRPRTARFVQGQIRLRLAATGRLMAMQGNRYPITEIGLETLVVRLIEKGTRDKQNGAREECIVEFRKGAKINGRQCTMLEVKHPAARLLRFLRGSDLHRRRVQRAAPVRRLHLAGSAGAEAGHSRS